MNPPVGESAYHTTPQSLPADPPQGDDAEIIAAAPETPGCPAGWNFKALACALGVAFVIQTLFLPCMCALGTAKITLAFSFDILVLIRMLIAWVMREQGRGWIFYLVLIYTSPLWIKGLVWAFTSEF